MHLLVFWSTKKCNFSSPTPPRCNWLVSLTLVSSGDWSVVLGWVEVTCFAFLCLGVCVLLFLLKLFLLGILSTIFTGHIIT